METQPRKEVAGPILSSVNQRILQVGADGLPQLTVQPLVTKAQLQSLYFVVAAQPYVVEDPLDPDFGRYDGMLIGEVLVRKELEAAVKSKDLATIEIVMDRLLGKPLSNTKTESLTVSMGYEDFLKNQIARDAAPPATPIDASTVEEPPDEVSIFGDLA